MSRTAPATAVVDTSDLADLGRFLVALSRERLNVGALAARFPLSRPAMSHHLKVLADAGLLVRERQGRERVYRLDVKRCRGAVDRLRKFVLDCCAGSACC